MAKPLKYRSSLIVRPDSDPVTVHASRADIVVVDLRAHESHKTASEFCRTWAMLPSARPLSFLLPPFSSESTEIALTFAIREGAELVFLHDTENGAAVQRLDVLLRVAQSCQRQEPCGTGIVALANTAGILAAQSFRRCSNRLQAIGWDMTHEMDCEPASDTARLARAHIALAAAAAGVNALDSASATTDAQVFRSECVIGRAAGLAGKLSFNVNQVAIINEVFGNQPPAPGGRVISKTSDPPSA